MFAFYSLCFPKTGKEVWHGFNSEIPVTMRSYKHCSVKMWKSARQCTCKMHTSRKASASTSTQVWLTWDWNAAVSSRISKSWELGPSPQSQPLPKKEPPYPYMHPYLFFCTSPFSKQNPDPLCLKSILGIQLRSTVAAPPLIDHYCL